MKKRAWFCAAGLLLLMGAVTGCQGKYQEVAVTDASAETDTTPAPTKEIKIETTTEAPARRLWNPATGIPSRSAPSRMERSAAT